MDRTSTGDAAHNMTSIEDGDASENEQGGGDGLENEGGEEINDAESQPGGDGVPDGGAEDRGAGEDVGSEEGEAGDPEGGAGSKLDLSAIKQEIMKELAPHLPKAEEKPVDLTEEEWAQKEQETGLPRTAIKAFAQQQVRLYRQIEKLIDSRLGGIEKETAVSAMAKQQGFTDAPRYRKDMDEFLGQFDASAHKNPELLRAAYYYAKGKASSGAMRKAQKSTEANKRIAGTARPASPNTARRGMAKPLSAIQRDAASKMGMPDAEYQKLLSQRGKPIAI